MTAGIAVADPAHDRQIMPALDAQIRAALVESIQRFGVLVPIKVDQHGQIIDGHNRAAIADELNAPCASEVIVVRDEEHAQELARTLNLDRRHLDSAARATVAKGLKASGHSLRAIAGALGVHHSTVSDDLGSDYQVSGDPTPDNGEAETEATAAEPTPERVTGTDGKSYPAKRRASWTDAELLAVLDAYDSGATQEQLAEQFDTTQGNLSSNLLPKARAIRDAPQWTTTNPPRGDDKSRAAVDARSRLIAELAAQGLSTRQIAPRLGIGETGVASIAKRDGIEIPADAVVSGTRRINANRVVGETAMALEGLCMGLNLADPEELDPTQVAAWAESLRTSIKTLNRFLKEMTK